MKKYLVLILGFVFSCGYSQSTCKEFINKNQSTFNGGFVYDGDKLISIAGWNIVERLDSEQAFVYEYEESDQSSRLQTNIINQNLVKDPFTPINETKFKVLLTHQSYRVDIDRRVGISIELKDETKLETNTKYYLTFSQSNFTKYLKNRVPFSANWVMVIEYIDSTGKEKVISSTVRNSRIMPAPLSEEEQAAWERVLFVFSIPEEQKKNSYILRLYVRSYPSHFRDRNDPQPELGDREDYKAYMAIDNIKLRRAGDCIPVDPLTETDNSSFMPLRGTGAKYLVSGWVKEDRASSIVGGYSSSIDVSFGGGETHTASFTPVGNIIDGWQRIEGVFEIPASATDIKVALVKGANATASYFDDIRFHREDGNMKSFVYDPITKRLMAELDENNFATFYEYDKEGGLVRVKKETQKGIYTIQETRSSNAKN